MTVVTAGAENTSSGTSVTSSAVDTTGMTFLGVFTANFPSGGANHDGATPVTDNKGNTWTRLGTNPLKSNASAYMNFWYVSSPTVGASHTFTYTTSTAGDFVAVEAIGWDLAATSTPVDVGSTASWSTGASPLATPVSISTAQANELLICAWGDSNGGSVASTISDGSTPAVTWTNGRDDHNASGEPAGYFYSVVSSTETTLKATVTPTGGGSSCLDGMVSIKQSGGGGGTTQYYPFVSLLGVG